MKILFNHADYFAFEAKNKALKSARDLKDAERAGEAKNALVCFIAVEKPDEGKEDAVVRRSLEEIHDVQEKIGARLIIIYPYAHLSSNLSKPAVAEKILDNIHNKLKEGGRDVLKAPFGWYKAFKISGKGHPLAELSREITIEEEDKEGEGESEALKAEKSLKSKWYVLSPDGSLSPLEMKDGNPSGFNFAKHQKLREFALYELAKNRNVEKAPPHVEIMRKLELVDYEPGSDPGNLRYYPKGRLIKSLLEDMVTEEVKKYGAMEIEAPIMYDFEHPSLKKYLNRFPARQYTIDTPNKKVFLRFAACFGQFLMAHDATISYKNLPLRLYELTKYSFRVEKRGELTGLRRLRSFTMPDCHAFVSDFEMAKEEMKKRFELAQRVLTKAEIEPDKDLEMGLRVVKDFYEEHKDFVMSLVKKWGKPILVEMWDERFFYFVMKYEWNFIDALGKASALTTDQIDVENGKTYGINYIDSKGEEKTPLIMHLSPSGAIERVIYALLEKAYMTRNEGGVAKLPLWLSPTQVRVIPITEKNLAYAKKIADGLLAEGIRVDVDDRDLTLGKKIREATGEWTPYIAVVGDDEEKDEKVALRTRGEKEQKPMETKKLINIIQKKTEGLPNKGAALPALLSKRPKFVG